LATFGVLAEAMKTAQADDGRIILGLPGHDRAVVSATSQKLFLIFQSSTPIYR
jgi:hypothetical protein